jgi:hypothetical protein
MVVHFHNWLFAQDINYNVIKNMNINLFLSYFSLIDPHRPQIKPAQKKLKYCQNSQFKIANPFNGPCKCSTILQPN